MDILHNAEKLGGPNQQGGWQKKMARQRYQGGTVRKRGKRNPVWELQWREDYIKEDRTIGRRLVTVKIGTVQDLTRRQARKLADEKLRLLNQGQWTPTSTITVRDFVEGYFVPNFFPTLKPSTQERYRQTLNTHLLPAFGKCRLCDLGTLDVQRFVLQKMEAGLGWESANHHRNLLSKIFAVAKKWGYFSGANPVAGVELPEKIAVREKHILTTEQISRLMEVLPEPARTMVWLCLLTGLRIGEVLGLPWKHVDFTSGQIRVSQAIYRGTIGSPKTKCSKRLVSIPTALRTVLLRQRESAKQVEEELVFHTTNGTPYNDSNLLHRQLKPAGKKLGMPWLNWHTLRRTHITLFQVVGGSLRDAQAQLGHSKMSTTLEIYTLPIPEQQRMTVEKLSVLMANDGKSEQNSDGLPLATEQIQ
jgi:integrase